MVDMTPPEDMSFLVSISGTMSQMATAALQEVTIADTDLAVAGLIIKYAAEIDKGTMATLAKLGPLMLQAMEALQMSPRSRAQLTKKDSENGGTGTKPSGSALDELRNKRLTRQNGTPPVHPPVEGINA